MAKPKKKNDIALQNFLAGRGIVQKHPMFAPLMNHAYVFRQDDNQCPKDAWAVVSEGGAIHVHPTRRGEPEEWVYLLAHCLLHLGLDHFQEKGDSNRWNAACDCFIARFLGDLKLGRVPAGMNRPTEIPAWSEDRLYDEFMEKGIQPQYTGFGTNGACADMIPIIDRYREKVKWQDLFAAGLAMAVSSAVNVAAGYEPHLGSETSSLSAAAKAKNWFVSSYPLLGSLAASFRIIEDATVCFRMEISVAAIDATMREIYMNPAAGLDSYECRFVMAHELLHVGLRHQERRAGRDPYLWNVACDYVINGWLVEMGLGELPRIGVLYDPELKGLSAESVYDRIAVDMRVYRKLATLRGQGLGDMLEKPRIGASGDIVDLDEFYRRALSQGLSYHEEQGRGYLPVGLVEEIRALSQPPVPWDVELAQWFDHYFSPLEKVRTYARLSRRQSATPDIPRPRWVPAAGADDGRTYGVILDTSGSMDRALLARALGAISSYSLSRDVPLVRVVFCDAITYDQGYLSPEAIAETVKVKGRGGTLLQPGIDLLESTEDFPKDGPLLIITDGYCEPLRIRREHAFLIPKGSRLPFIPKGKVFRFS